ncbi:MAG: hypothetical protein AB7O31_16630 [Burkholderiales bacterium]
MASIYFSDFFGLPSEVVEDYGAFNVSLVTDLPLFVDPFLLFNSEDEIYRGLHEEIIEYMRFLKQCALDRSASPALVDAWFAFPEVKQNWLGFSQTGNAGHGLGRDFARALHRNFSTVFQSFGDETLTRSSHLEKLCLVRDGVGRDTISDFTTNLIQPYLGTYTQAFALHHLKPSQRRRVALLKARFNYATRSWSPMTFELPYVNGDFVLLTPRDILTKDNAWINRPELLDRLPDIAASIPDDALRSQLNDYLERRLSADPDATKDQVREIIAQAVEQFPRVLDYYIRDKELHGADAKSLAEARVQFIQTQFVKHVRSFVTSFLEPSDFYSGLPNTYDEAKRRLLFLKDVIENKGGHRMFFVDGKPIEREADLQILYRLTWFATPSDATREANDGRGSADFKISRGSADKTLVEFKLAKNKHLERNLERQAEIYEKASDATHPSLKAILYFTGEQLVRVQKILARLELASSPHIVLIDACSDNKPSGSVA